MGNNELSLDEYVEKETNKISYITTVLYLNNCIINILSSLLLK